MNSEAFNELSDKSRLYVSEKINDTLIKGPRIIVFLFPPNAWNEDTNFEVEENVREFNPICPGGHLLTGLSRLITVGPQDEDHVWFCYAAIDDKGIIESCDRRSLITDIRQFNLDEFADNFSRCIREYMDIYNSLDVDYPVFALVSLVEMKGYRLLSDDSLEIQKEKVTVGGPICSEDEVEDRITLLLTRIRQSFYPIL